MLFLREFPWAFLPLPCVVANMAVALTGDCAIQRKTEVPTVYVPCGRPRCHHFRFLTFIFCVLVLSLHVYLCIICVVPFGSERRLPEDWNFGWLWAAMFGLGIQPGSSGRTPPLSTRAVSTVLIISRKERILATLRRLTGGIFYCASISVALEEFICYNL